MRLFVPTCREVARLAAEGRLDDAPPPVRWLARAHLLLCGRCRRFVRELSLLGLAARERGRGLVEPRALRELEDRLISRLS